MAFWISDCEAFGTMLANSVTCRCRASRLMSDAADPFAKPATFSSGIAPSLRRGNHEPADGLLGRPVFSLGAKVHFVLLASLVVGRHLVAADQPSQRFCRVADLDAEVRRLRPIDLHRQLRLA